MLFNDSLNYFHAAGFTAIHITRDLHADGFEPNYVSEHEAKFSSQGIPIKFGIFRKEAVLEVTEKLKFYLRESDNSEESENPDE